MKGLKVPSLAPASPPLAPAVRFRGEIEKAEAEGLALETLTLRLTHADASKLKRDPSLAVADISFTDGTMRFLGVRVQPGGVPQSLLERPEPAESPQDG